MSASLYDPAFATLSQHTGASYRRAVTALTLLGGFASTVFWPLSQWLFDAHGWRWTLGCYAVLQLALCLPIHLLVIPRGSAHARAHDRGADTRSAGFSDPRLRFLSAAFAMTSFVTGVVGVHMVGLLSGAGLTTKEAVAISMLMGPMQVAGRIVELVFARRVRTVTVGVIAFLLISSAVGILIVSHAWMWAVVFVAAYGFGNGVMTIVKGTIPAELYGREGLGELLGYLSRANAYATALGPAAWTALALGLGRSGGLVAVAAVGLGGLAAFSIATRSRTAAVAAERT
jgi:predicted MFS family arabinose efflux permease